MGYVNIKMSVQAAGQEPMLQQATTSKKNLTAYTGPERSDRDQDD